MIYKYRTEKFELCDKKYTISIHLGDHPKHGRGFSIFIYEGELTYVRMAFVSFAYNHIVKNHYYLRINNDTKSISSAREGKRQILLFLMNPQ